MDYEQIQKNYKNGTRGDKIKIRKQLVEQGMSMCVGELCGTKVRELGEFWKGERSKCKQCSYICKKRSYKNSGYWYNKEKYRLLWDKSCELCGCDDLVLLEHDHLDPKTKKYKVSSTISKKRQREEADKCRILCIWCHRLHSYEQSRERVRTKWDYYYTLEEELEPLDILNCKKCTGPMCQGNYRNIKWFLYDKINKTLRSRCVKCHNYRLHLIRMVNREHVVKKKLNIDKCNKCGKKVTRETTCCFDFDHIIQEKKISGIAKLVQFSRDIRNLIDEEIKHCQLLCCKCHKKKTAKQLGYMKPTYIKKIEPYERYNNCPKCDGQKDSNANMCEKCYKKNIRKVERPDYEIILNEIRKMGFKAVGRKYGVTDNTIRKWMRYYEKYEGKENPFKPKKKLPKPSYEILINDIKKLSRKGTAEKYGVLPNTISEWKVGYEKELGIYRQRNKVVTPEKEVLVELLKTNTRAEVASQYSVCIKQVHNWKKYYGLI